MRDELVAAVPLDASRRERERERVERRGREKGKKVSGRKEEEEGQGNIMKNEAW